MALALPGRVSDAFHQLARETSNAVGRPKSFLIALAVIVVWALTGPLFKFSDTWQLIINTGTTIVTFLMVFLIQNTQNRDAKAVHLKLDELLRATRAARNTMLDLEHMADAELEELAQQFRHLRAIADEKRRTLPSGDRSSGGDGGGGAGGGSANGGGRNGGRRVTRGHARLHRH
jgi:low affinity Fe/Cu permease